MDLRDVFVPLHRQNNRITPEQAQISSKVFKTNDKITIDSFYHKGYLDDAPDTLYGIKQLTYIVLVYLKQPFHGIHIQVESSLPPQRGLGSSASVSIAIIVYHPQHI